MYRKIFNTEFNIGFHIPKKDTCRHCETFHKLPEHEKALHITEFEAHQSRKQQSREHKNRDKATAQTTLSLKAIIFDLEQVTKTQSVSRHRLWPAPLSQPRELAKEQKEEKKFVICHPPH
ncbi:hypothetical protein SKAU_G00273870 [Synaphobranchus kaupii]|uniref:Uncharacterized protein n=1 Tax=Synaphobranchus kaupii TaxID=118154 RepID=A0A9Q1F0V4_SYNKA|nr:hypothetical protein SKAU_G00273870 [Synaphobranchus kaupii]